MKYSKILLSKVADVIAGQSPPSNLYNKRGEGLPFFQGKADFGDKYPVVRNWCTGNKHKEAKSNDILISVRAPVGPVNICNARSIIGRGLSAIRVKPGNSAEYLYYYLKNIEPMIARLGTGSTFKAITQSQLSKIIVPIPSNPDDQIRIATVLSKAEKLIAKRKESIKALDELLKSTFLEMFGDPVSNEKGWELSPLGEKLRIKHGFAFKGEYFSNIGEFVLLTPGNFFEEGGYRDRGDKQKYYQGEIPKEYLLNEGDLLIAMTEQAPGLLGSALIVPESNRFLHNQRLGLIIQDNNDFNRWYLFHLFNHHSIRTLIHLKATGTKVRHTSPSKIEEIKVSVPPLPLQNQFATIVEKVESLKQKYTQSLTELEALYDSFSQRAFKGELEVSRVPMVNEI
jgi:type I restriction enzyme S subunit